MGVPGAIIELLILLIGIGCCVAGFFLAKMLRNSK
jgi:hypothetical protein